jgi:endonuclease YncB( thermonuclease family)
MFVSVVKSAFKINLVIKYLFWYQISGKEKEYTATVVEVVNGDGLMVKTTDGTVKKVFLASIRPPREQR